HRAGVCGLDVCPTVPRQPAVLHRRHVENRVRPVAVPGICVRPGAQRVAAPPPPPPPPPPHNPPNPPPPRGGGPTAAPRPSGGPRARRAAAPPRAGRAQ